jgi:hypothetical protein
MTAHYIGFKQILGYEQEKEGKAGYAVTYPDGYVSWSPKEMFEKAYLKVQEENKITEVDVLNFIHKVETSTIGNKTTFVHVTLKNGFVLTESSSCVDSANYNEALGHSICMERIHNKVWMLLGFLLQSARFGLLP